MRKSSDVFVRYIVALCLFLQPSLLLAQSNTVQATPEVANQILTNAILDRLFTEYAQLKKVSDFSAWMVRRFPERDHMFLKKHLSRLNELPQLERLNRGLKISIGKESSTIEVLNAYNGRMKFDGKLVWSFNPNQTLESQFKIFERGLVKKDVSRFQLLIPKANAWAWVLWGLAAFMVGTSLNPIATDVVTNYFYPKGKAEVCEGKDPSVSFEIAEYCKAYFAWKTQHRPTLPPAATVTDTSKVKETVGLTSKCRSPQDPDIVAEVESPDKKLKTRRTIKFGPDNKPIQVIEESVKPESPFRLVYTMDEKGNVETIETRCDNGKCAEEKSLFLSRKKEHANQMDTEKTKVLDELEKALRSIRPLIEQCDEKAKAIARSAEQPGLMSSQVLKVEEKMHGDSSAKLNSVK